MSAAAAVRLDGAQALSLVRGSYRESGDSKLQPLVTFTVKLDAAHALLLDLVSRCVFCDGAEKYAGELIENEIERAFEQATRMRAGVFLAGVASGAVDVSEVKAKLTRLRVR